MTVFELSEAPHVGQKAVVLFWASWHEGSMGPMSAILDALDASSSSSSNGIRFARINADAYPSVCAKYRVTAVPTFLFFDEMGTVVERMEGVDDVSQVTLAVARLEASKTTTAPATVAKDSQESLSVEEQLNRRLNALIRSSEVMLFMKGVPVAPRCGFSRQAVELLQQENISFGSFDILTDEAVRQGLKKLSNWPTYPQIYVHGELIGGIDILKELREQGPSLREQLGISNNNTAPSLEERLKQLTHQNKIMLFMKGLPSAPRCGFSRQIVEILNQENVSYDAFDILTDEDVRQGLKKFSNWPTYPQLYVNGELVGGLDIVKEMKEDGSLRDVLCPPS